MDDDSKIELLKTVSNILLRPKEKTENKKILTILFCTFFLSVIIGVDLQNWRQWKTDMQVWKEQTTQWKIKKDAQIIELQSKHNIPVEYSVKN